ncbi:MAG: hypothetical protein MZV64_52585 [Ignavibacteriales bacterium]|nr:hypothetical protein [Ignavibacteriales bacterium]
MSSIPPRPTTFGWPNRRPRSTASSGRSRRPRAARRRPRPIRPRYCARRRTRRRCYVLYYRPQDFKADGKFRRIDVTVKRGGLRVSHREGYVAEDASAAAAKTESGAGPAAERGPRDGARRGGRGDRPDGAPALGRARAGERPRGGRRLLPRPDERFARFRLPGGRPGATIGLAGGQQSEVRGTASGRFQTGAQGPSGRRGSGTAHWVYDYQLARKDGWTAETRILLEEDGKPRREERAALQTDRFVHKLVVLGPIGLFGEDAQSRHDYVVAKETEMDGEPVLVVDVRPKGTEGLVALRRSLGPAARRAGAEDRVGAGLDGQLRGHRGVRHGTCGPSPRSSSPPNTPSKRTVCAFPALMRSWRLTGRRARRSPRPKRPSLTKTTSSSRSRSGPRSGAGQDCPRRGLSLLRIRLRRFGHERKEGAEGQQGSGPSSPALSRWGSSCSVGPGRAAGGGRQAGQIREEVTVTLKLLQAYVTTKDGKPVTDLTAADFEVTRQREGHAR